LGVPCLVSDMVGCQGDLVIDGKTGWVFKAGKLDQLRAKLAEALHALRADRHAFRSAATEHIASYNYEQSTNGLLAALQHVTGRPASRL